jgi:uncharacterized membrane protein HdeD (DUF308 family)
MATVLESTSTTGNRSVWFPILLIVLGLFVMASPVASSIGVAITVGTLLLVAGAVQFIHAFRYTGVGPVVWRLLVAICYLVAGMYLVTHPVLGLAGLTLALGAFFFSKGFLDIVTYFSTSKAVGSGWILLDGVITLLLGMMIWSRWPISSLWVIGTLVGLGMLMSGVTRLMMALAWRELHRVTTEPADHTRRAA